MAIEQRAYTLDDAPTETQGLVWSDRIGEWVPGYVYEYSTGGRNVSSVAARGVRFTHWHPYPPSPTNA